MILWEGTIKRIHVNQHLIRANVKDGGDRPVLTVKCGGKTHTAHHVEIDGPSRLVTNANPLDCGARVWIETTARVELTARESDAEAQETA